MCTCKIHLLFGLSFRFFFIMRRGILSFSESGSLFLYDFSSQMHAYFHYSYQSLSSASSATAAISDQIELKTSSKRALISLARSMLLVFLHMIIRKSPESVNRKAICFMFKISRMSKPKNSFLPCKVERERVVVPVQEDQRLLLQNLNDVRSNIIFAHINRSAFISFGVTLGDYNNQNLWVRL